MQTFAMIADIFILNMKARIQYLDGFIELNDDGNTIVVIGSEAKQLYDELKHLNYEQFKIWLCENSHEFRLCPECHVIIEQSWAGMCEQCYIENQKQIQYEKFSS